METRSSIISDAIEKGRANVATECALHAIETASNFIPFNLITVEDVRHYDTLVGLIQNLNRDTNRRDAARALALATTIISIENPLVTPEVAEQMIALIGGLTVLQRVAPY